MAGGFLIFPSFQLQCFLRFFFYHGQVLTFLWIVKCFKIVYKTTDLNEVFFLVTQAGKDFPLAGSVWAHALPLVTGEVGDECFGILFQPRPLFQQGGWSQGLRTGPIRKVPRWEESGSFSPFYRQETGLSEHW